MTRFRRWLAGAAVLLALMVAVDFALSMLVGTARISRLLTARLEASFGRPVQVGRFQFSLWDGPGIEADSVRVGEDPRFGNEYFLRAGQMAATLRLGPLLRGRVAFGSFSLSNASLNVVTSKGQWNLADWLPPAARHGTSEPRPTPRLYRIEIDNGRIDFKHGTVKLPFALVDVNGTVDETAPDRWSLSLSAEPMRAAVTLQDAGTLHLTGRVGGTSARLRPASLHLRWENASIPDVLRLFFGYDYGVRGQQNLDLLASSAGKLWRFELDSRTSGLHRWDFAGQPGNPGVGVRLAGSWSPGEGKLTLASGRISGPTSSVSLNGGAEWPVAGLDGGNGGPVVPQFHLRLSNMRLSARDLLSWYRSFHESIPASLHARGRIEGTADIDGWPPRIQKASLVAVGLRATGGALVEPVEMASANLQISKGKATASIPKLDLGSEAGSFQITGSARRARQWEYRVKAKGASRHIGDLLAAMKTLGVRAPGYWQQFSGGAAINVDWRGTIPFSQAMVLASIDLRNAVWRNPSLPAGVRLKNARVGASENRLRFDIRSASALGTSWHGWLERRRPSGAWHFALWANRLQGRRLVARFQAEERRPSLLERIFGFGNAAGLPPLWPASLDARGTIELDRLTIGSLALSRVRANVAIHAGDFALSATRADFYGGLAQGSFFFSIRRGVPVWRLGTRLDRINLEELSRAVEGEKHRFSGLARADLQLSARGATPRSMVDSLRGRAQISFRDAGDSGMDWLATLKEGHPVSGSSRFERCLARVRVSAGNLILQSLSADSRRGRLEATGGIDLAHGAALKLDARLLPGTGPLASGETIDVRTYRVTGSPLNPSVHFLSSTDPSKAPKPPIH